MTTSGPMGPRKSSQSASKKFEPASFGVRGIREPHLHRALLGVVRPRVVAKRLHQLGGELEPRGVGRFACGRVVVPKDHERAGVLAQIRGLLNVYGLAVPHNVAALCGPGRHYEHSRRAGGTMLFANAEMDAKYDAAVLNQLSRLKWCPCANRATVASSARTGSMGRPG